MVFDFHTCHLTVPTWTRWRSHVELSRIIFASQVFCWMSLHQSLRWQQSMTQSPRFWHLRCIKVSLVELVICKSNNYVASWCRFCNIYIHTYIVPEGVVQTNFQYQRGSMVVMHTYQETWLGHNWSASFNQLGWRKYKDIMCQELPPCHPVIVEWFAMPCGAEGHISWAFLVSNQHSRPLLVPEGQVEMLSKNVLLPLSWADFELENGIEPLESIHSCLSKLPFELILRARHTQKAQSDHLLGQSFEKPSKMYCKFMKFDESNLFLQNSSNMWPGCIARPYQRETTHFKGKNSWSVSIPFISSFCC